MPRRKPSRARVNRARRKYGSSSDKLLAAFTSSDIRAQRSQARRKKEVKDRETVAAERKRSDRMLQLAAMPKGRGESELKRMQQGGASTETPAAKARRQRAAQLRAMPEGRGQKLLKKMAAAKKKNYKPTTITQPSGLSKSPTEKIQFQPKSQSGKKMVKNPYTRGAKKQTQSDAAKKRMAETAKKFGLKK